MDEIINFPQAQRFISLVYPGTPGKWMSILNKLSSGSLLHEDSIRKISVLCKKVSSSRFPTYVLIKFLQKYMKAKKISNMKVL